jgi:hypothetical protein
VDYCGLIAVNPFEISAPGAPITQGIIDIAVGGAGSEVVIIPNLRINQGYQTVSSFISVEIPAGTRVSVRAQTHNASVSYGIALLGGYK